MGDIIASRKAADEVILHEVFNTMILTANKKYADLIISPLTITLGDEFQGLTKNLESSFQIANFIRMELLRKKVDMRFVIGNVKIDESIVNMKSSWNMMGAGLAEARELLNDKNNKNSYRFTLISNRDTSTRVFISLLNTIGNSITAIGNK